MPPKSSKSAGNALAEAGGEPDKPLQAVLIADGDYSNRFLPLTLEKPRCLLPFLGRPLLEHTLESLAASNVQEVYILAAAFPDQISTYLASSRWALPQRNHGHSGGSGGSRTLPSMKVSILSTTEAQTFGDAMRDLDAKGLVAEDFLLVTGDLISNIDLREPLRQHRETREKDKNAILTMILRESDVGPLDPVRPIDAAGIFLIDADTASCIHYEPNPPFPPRNAVELDAEILEGHPHVQVRNDLIDCQVDICSLEVPALWTENFDYQAQREHFLYGVLTSDLLGKTCYAHILPAGTAYAARVRDPRLYDAVARDVLRRRAFPLHTPEDLLSEHTIIRQGQSYIHPGATIGRDAHIGRGVMVGDGVIIGEGARLEACTIGDNARIGEGASIIRSYLWSGVSVGANSTVSGSILADNVIIGTSSTITPGCILSFGVVIDDAITLPPSTRLTLSLPSGGDGFGSGSEDAFGNDMSEEEGNSDDNTWADAPTSQKTSPTSQAQDITYDTGIVGPKGRGRIWTRGLGLNLDDEEGHSTSRLTDASSGDEDDLEDEGDEDRRCTAIADLAYDLSSLRDALDEGETSDSESDGSDEDYSMTEEDDEDDFSDDNDSPGPSRIQGLSNIQGGSGDSEEFIKELRQTLARALKGDHEVEVAALEINTLRMTFNGHYRVIRQEVAHALLALSLPRDEGGLARPLRPLLEKWAGLLQRLVHDAPDQLALINILQDWYAAHPAALSGFRTALHQLYEHDVLEEHILLQWWASPPPKELSPAVRQSVSAFIQWLQEADEESEEDDEEDETESDEE